MVVGSVAVIAVDYLVTQALISLHLLRQRDMVEGAVDTLKSGRASSEPDEPVVAFEHVSLAFDDKVILKDVSFTLNSGHTTIILGASGAGKSITLKIIMGLLKPDAGAVWVTVNGSTNSPRMP